MSYTNSAFLHEAENTLGSHPTDSDMTDVTILSPHSHATQTQVKRDSAASPCRQSEKSSKYSATDVCMSAKSLQSCLTSCESQ